ncbi:NFACT family protein [Christensenellaceae bacterium OttesenSCG-928-K19]|nr:NFACT family protein [Christensenellaceae bacterium OttesenSCG-928-K19]
MTLDGLTLHCTVEELKTKIENAKVQKVLMPARDEIVLQLYSAAEGTLRLCVSADAGDCAVYLTANAKKNPKTPPLFCMFLRKHLTGAVITHIEQSGLNRVVTITFSARDELMRQIELKMIVEIMGKYSNVILTDSNGKILDSIRRVSADVSSMRVILPAMPYHDPPQQKLNPVALSQVSLIEALSTKQDVRVTTQITSVLDGISTQTALEILHRAGVETDAAASLAEKQVRHIAATMQEFLTDAIEHPQPCVQLNQDGLPVFFSCVPYQTYPEQARTAFDTCNEMLDYYYARRAELFRLQQQKDSLAKSIGKQLARVEKRIRIYQASMDDVARAGKFQKRADYITANLYRLKKGMKSFETADYETGEPVSIQLDVSMTPQEQAQKLYKKIAKYKRAAAMNETKLAQALDEQDFLLGALHYTENADNGKDIADIRSSLAKAGYLASPPKGKKEAEAKNESQPMHFVSQTGYEIFVGKNDRQNDILTMRMAGKDDIWFHAQKIPGSHVLLVTDGKALDDIDDDTVVYAATLAAKYSRARQSGKTPVDYTQRKNVKKPPNSRPGKVIYDDYFTVYVDASTD